MIHEHYKLVDSNNMMCIRFECLLMDLYSRIEMCRTNPINKLSLSYCESSYYNECNDILRSCGCKCIDANFRKITNRAFDLYYYPKSIR